MTLRTAGKKGALPNDPGRPRISLNRALTTGAAAPPQVHWGHIPLIGMLGNDQWGCCVYSGAGDLIEAESFWGQGREIELTTAQVLTGYSAATGFDPAAGPPGANPTDNGSDLQTGLGYLQKTGFAGKKITAFGELHIGDTSGWQLALSLFGPLMAGIGVSAKAMQQFSQGEPWSLASGDQPVSEDHCIILTGYQPGLYFCWTWGAIQAMTPGWFAQNAYEVWGVVTPDWVSTYTGKDPEGVSLAALGQEYQEVTGQPDPFPVTGASASIIADAPVR